MKTLTMKCLAICFLVCATFLAQAQAEKGEVKVKISKEIDGEQKTFEKTYESDEAMKNDPALKEFMGEDQQMNFWFSDDDGGKRIIEFNQDGDNGFFFGFGDQENVFKWHDLDSMSENFSFHFDGMSEEHAKEIREKLKELDFSGGSFQFFDDDHSFDLMFGDESIDDIKIHIDKLKEDMDGAMKEFEVVVIKRVKISEDVEEFGKKAEVKESRKLILDDLQFFPNPAPNGKFQVRFSHPNEADMSLKVFDLSGKEVYNRAIDGFRGRYSETMDLSKQPKGVYLLEISLDDKRLTRKIAID